MELIKEKIFRLNKITRTDLKVRKTAPKQIIAIDNDIHTSKSHNDQIVDAFDNLESQILSSRGNSTITHLKSLRPAQS